MVKLKKKSLSRGSFRTHGQVIGNKNFFFFGLTSFSARFVCNFDTVLLKRVRKV